ncbi:hypothetical protein IP87_12320 [beta proteobacterium AAP121]|nr:hypothetical protein IP80_09585 [beta proteobacterium AAP65]KPF97160.1 hypothetical protein IP87_12320 [beta proteobacterium AAP121]
MRAAPAVAVQGRGGPLWAALSAGLPACAAAAFVAWLAAHAEAGATGTAAAAALAGGAVLLWQARRWRTVPRASLQWDGQRWTADGTPGTLQLMLDLGPVLVLRLHAEAGGTRWLAIGAGEAGPAWHALRCAVYSRPPRATPRVLSPERSPD